jgi:hypothetical protein
MKALFSLGLCSLTCAAVGGEFVNLTFDQPDLSRLQTGPTGIPIGPVEDLLRGWEVSIRPPAGQWSSFKEEIEFFGTVGGIPPISLNSGMHFDRTDYSVFFNSRFSIGSPPGPIPLEVRLSTTGTVPENALTFDWYEGAGLELRISDGVRTLTAVGNPGSMNISQFAGKEVTISFLQRSGSVSSVDVIGFSLVPEPETWALLGAGLVGLFAWFRYRRE